MGYNLLINGVYWGYNPLTNHLLTSWNIQVGGPPCTSLQPFLLHQGRSRPMGSTSCDPAGRIETVPYDFGRSKLGSQISNPTYL